MDVKSKLNILADAAKYDVSCSSSGSSRTNSPKGVGNAARSGICHSWADDGRCISLLKILYTNYCIYDCAYCVNRASNDTPRASFTPEEVVNLTINFYRRNYIEGLFLSSAIEKKPDHTMEQLLATVKKLREERDFNGYIHLKAIPGADPQLVEQAGTYADRMSVNIELPSQEGLQKLAPGKKKEDILQPMELIGNKIIETKENKQKYNSAPDFVPAGQSTQLIVGATPEPDYQILKLSESLYQKMNLKRVYYSAYVPVNDNSQLPALKKPPLLREHRLYQADWLLRFYNFSADELLTEEKPELDLDFDPKLNWAIRNIDKFPMEINKASYDQLLRIPGVGPKSARRIVTNRQEHQLNYQDLKQIGPVLKRAKYFITCRGNYYGGLSLDSSHIKKQLKQRLAKGEQWEQQTLF